MGKVITIINNKGGVGKTTTVINLGVALSKLDKKVLLVDIDAQANLTDILNGKQEITIKDLLENEDADINNAIVKGVRHNIDLIPSTTNLSGALQKLNESLSRETVLKRILKPIISNYDYILIDNPPALDLFIFNSLTASNEVIIPISTDYHALSGTKTIINLINQVQTLLNENLTLRGVLVTMYDERTNNDKNIKETIQETFKGKCFNTVIRANVKVKEATSRHKSVIEYDEKSNGAKDYIELAKEIIKGV